MLKLIARWCCKVLEYIFFNNVWWVSRISNSYFCKQNNMILISSRFIIAWTSVRICELFCIDKRKTPLFNLILDIIRQNCLPIKYSLISELLHTTLNKYNLDYLESDNLSFSTPNIMKLFSLISYYIHVDFLTSILYDSSSCAKRSTFFLKSVFSYFCNWASKAVT